MLYRFIAHDPSQLPVYSYTCQIVHIYARTMEHISADGIFCQPLAYLFTSLAIYCIIIQMKLGGLLDVG